MRHFSCCLGDEKRSFEMIDVVIGVKNHLCDVRGYI